MIYPQKTFYGVIFCAISLLLQTGCASSKALNKKSDYKIPTVHLKNADFKMALKTYPKKEKKGFITLTEMSWMRLLNGQSTAFDEIKKMGGQLPEKETIILSEEASHFFYQRTAEGYFPAEHEVIVFHLISSMSLLQQENREAAYVEAKRAAFYLQDDYVSRSGAFDDPFLRVWLASIWVALDEWNSAQVDLRKASELSNSYQWAADLAKLASAPKRWLLAFQGTGPELRWDPKGFQEHWTGRGSLEFDLVNHTKIHFLINDQKQKGHLAKGSSAMYERHQKRNAAIRDALETSDYMMKSSSLYVGAGAAKGMGKMANASFKIVGLALGGAIIAGTIYLLAKSGANSQGAGELAALGVGLGIGSFEKLSAAGSDIDSSVTKSVDTSLDEALDLSKTYRYVRFLPDTLLLSISEETVGKAQLAVFSEGVKRQPFLKVKTNNGSVEFFFQPL